jgi:endoglucanase
MRKLGGSKVSGKAMDNRAGCLALCELSKRICPDANLVYLFSTQEEVGTRGAIAALNEIRPDVAICVDVTQGDMHFLDSPVMRKLGGGAIIGTGPNIHPNIFRALVGSADRSGIRYTTKAYARPTPTNLRSMQLLAGGVPSGLLAIPCRYMHTPNEIVDVNDISSVIALLEAFIDDVDDVIERGF